MTAYYKATRPDGRDFHSGTIDYAAALASGDVIRHPVKRKVRNDAGTYLSVSIAAADCTGFRWPCRLFRVEVEPVGRVTTADGLPNKRCVSALRVVEELPAWQALGPNGEAVVAFIERLRTLTPAEVPRLDARAAARAAWDAAGAAAWAAAWAAAGDGAWAAARAAWDAAGAAAWDAAVAGAWAAARAAWDAAGAAAWDAAVAAAGAIVVRDLITSEQYAVLVRPFVDAGLGEWVK